MAKKTDDNFDFEKSIAELSTIVEQLEKGGISLQDSLKQFEAGVKLTRQCQDALSKAEQKVKILQDEQLNDFHVEDE